MELTGAGGGNGSVATAFVAPEVVEFAAISVEFVGACRSTRVSGRINEAGIAEIRANRSGEGPVCFK